MESTQARLVVVDAKALDEVLELARLLTERLPQTDPLTLALRGAIGQCRADALLEP